MLQSDGRRDRRAVEAPVQGFDIQGRFDPCEVRSIRWMTGSFCSIAFASTVPVVRPSSFAITVIGLVPASFLSRLRSSSLHDCFQRAMSPGPATQAPRPDSDCNCPPHEMQPIQVCRPRQGAFRQPSAFWHKLHLSPSLIAVPMTGWVPACRHSRPNSLRCPSGLIRARRSTDRICEDAKLGRDSVVRLQRHVCFSKCTQICPNRSSCATAAARPNVITPMRACAEKYWRNNAALGCDPESTDPALWRAAQCSLAPRLRPHCIVTLAAFDGAAAQTANQPPDTMAARVEACTPCHGNTGRRHQRRLFPAARRQAGRLSLQPAARLPNGRRKYPPMNYLLEFLPDPYLKEMAEYFAERASAACRSPRRARSARTCCAHGETARRPAAMPRRNIPACVELPRPGPHGHGARHPRPARPARRPISAPSSAPGATAPARRNRPTACSSSPAI